MSSADGGGFPSWVLLETFVFRRDDDESFPDDTRAPIRASGTSSWGARFRVAFDLVEPPRISRIYAQLPQPGFLDPMKSNPLSIVATHRHRALLHVGTQTPEMLALQDFFIYSSAGENPCSVKALPPCREPDFDYYTRDDGSLPRRRRRRPTPPSDDAPPRPLNAQLMGLWCPSGGKEEEFVVAELSLYKPSNISKVFADIYLLRSSDHQLSGGGAWSSMRVLILSTDNPDDKDLWRLCCWETETVIPFQRWLCWIDYHQGILFCDMSKLPTPSVSFFRFPVDKSAPPTSARSGSGSGSGSGSSSDSGSGSDADADIDTDDTSGLLYHGASVVDHGRALKLVNGTRHDGIPFGALKPGTGFTITCHTLMLGSGGDIRSMAWEEDYTVTSRELWDANHPDRLPRDILMFPRVDIDRPHVVHFLFMEFEYVKKKMWTVSIDMSTKTVQSFSMYINGNEGLQTDDDADLIIDKSMSPKPFLPCEFPRFCRLSRKRKDTE
ncbi:unnamed protein product [Urochloa decumbens]|uniref:DUF1618 domain-containing protein n=1 Tax=Urochloa decumbens TaxID=240449 RepID=A0ABC8VGJ5_9POAL